MSKIFGEKLRSMMEYSIQISIIKIGRSITYFVCHISVPTDCFVHCSSIAIESFQYSH